MELLGGLNPDWALAQAHGKSSKAGIPVVGRDGFKEVCPCCYYVIEKEPIGLCQNPKELQFLGFGFPLFYTFLKNCIMLLMITICSYSLLEITEGISQNQQYCAQNYHNTGHSNISENDHSPPHLLLRHQGGGNAVKTEVCQQLFVKISSLNFNLSHIEHVIRIGSFIIHLLFLVYMRDNVSKLKEYYDERNTSLSDYSLMIKNIPNVVENPKKTFTKFFKDQFLKPHEFKQITLLPNHQEIQESLEEKKKVIKKLKKLYKEEEKGKLQNIEYINQINEQIEEIDDEIMIEAKKIKKKIQRDELYCNRIIFVFNSEEEKDQIIDQFKTIDLDRKQIYFGEEASSMLIKEAPEPKQILWENIDIGGKEKTLRKILGWFLSFMVIAIVTVIFYFIEVGVAQRLVQIVNQLHQHPNDEQLKKDYFWGAFTINVTLVCVILFNKLLMVVFFHKFTDLQRHSTMSKFQFSFALKYCLGLFFTTALMTLAVEAITMKNYYQHPYGVIEQETIMFLLNSFFVPIFWFINPFQLIKVYKRNKLFGKKYVSQEEAHHLMEDTQYEMGKRYAQVLETMWFVFLYVNVIPIGTFLEVIGLSLYYWVDKYNLLRRSSINSEVSGALVMTSMKLLDLTLVMKPVGEIMFDAKIRNGALPTSIVMAIVGLVYFLLPLGKIIELINDQKFRKQTKTYDQMKNKFKTTYHSEHPIIKLTSKSKRDSKLLSTGHYTFWKSHNSSTMDKDKALSILAKML